MTITVFLADDHTIVRDGLRYLLDSQTDLRVIGDADNGREAARQVLELCPDVSVMDIAMPELSGIEATRRIKEVCASTQVLILSMHSTTEHIFQALQAGASGYLLKKSASSEVAAAVRAVHAGHRYLSQSISDKLVDDYVRQRQLAGSTSPLDCLSRREREVLRLVVEGNTSAEIGDLLSLSAKTIETYRSRMMRKLSIHDLPSLVKFAITYGLTSLD
jgi:DNA-binding NarL/FixJ family response regulator